MRSIVLFVFLALATSLAAQLPSFQSSASRAALSPASLAAVGAEFSDFERVDFDEAPLASYLRQNPGQTTFELALGSRAWTIDLEPNDVRTADYVLRVADANGIHSLPRSANVTYKGFTRGPKPAEVRLTVAKDFIYGMVASQGDAVFFQSQWLTDSTARPEAVLIFTGKDGILPAEHACGTDGDVHSTPSSAASQQRSAGHAHRSVGDCKEVQLAIASDFLMYQAHGNNVATLEARNVAVMNNVNSDYSGSFADDYIFTVTEQFVSTCSSCDPWTSSTNSGTLLDAFTSWGPGGFSGTHDLGQLWTNRDFNGSTIGVAWLGAVCTSSRYHILQDFSSNPDLTRVLVSHEIGHNFDCDHDASGSPFIMAPSVQFTSTWSSASITRVNTYGPTRSCLSTISCSGGGNTPPIAGFGGGPFTICETQSVTFVDQSTSATSYSWSFPGGTPSTSSDPTPTVTYSTAGLYDVTLTVTNALGTDTKTETNYVSVSPLPTVGFTSAITGPLQVSFTNVTTNATNFQWSFGDGATSTSANPVHTYSTGGSYNVILTAFNSCGSATTTQIITVLVPPVADFTANVTSGCAPLSVQFTNQSTGPISGYTWSFPGGSPSSSTTLHPSVIYTQPGVYDVTLTVGNQSGSDSKVETGFIIVDPDPVAGFSESVTGSTVSVTSTATNATTVMYDFGDGTTSNLPNDTHTYSSGGTYQITQTVTGICGTATTSTTITINSAPVPSFTVTGGECLGDAITITSTSSGNPSSFNYTVTQPNGSLLTSTNNPYTFTATQRGSYDVALTVANSTGQASTNVVDAFSILEAPTVNFSTTISGQTVAFSGFVSTVAASGASYVWDFGDGNTGTGMSPTHTYASSGSFQVTLDVFNGCESASSTQTVTVGSAPTATITASSSATSLCPGDAITYTANVSGNATSITWSLPGSNQPTPTGMQVTAVYPAAGSFGVSVQVCNSIGCNTQVLAGGVTVNVEADADFSFSSSGALGVNFSDQSSGATSVSYTFGDGNSSSQANPTHTYSAAGTYTVTQTVTGPCGTDMTSRVVTVGQAPVADFDVVLPGGTLCPGVTVSYVDMSTGAASYDWSFPGGSPAQSSSANPSITYNQPGSYDATLTVTNALGTNSITMTSVVVVAAAPTASFTSSVNGLMVSFTSLTSGVTSVDWDFGNGTSSSASNPSVTYAAPGTYTVTLTATGPCGSETVMQTVTVQQAPVADFGVSVPAGTLCPGVTVQYIDQSTAAASYAWSFPGGTPAQSTQASPTVTYTQAGTYDATLTVTNSLGSNTMTLPNAVTVAALPSADFTSLVTGLMVDFASQSTGATSLSWDFGDGTSAASNTPSHTYQQTGAYTVTLTATNACGTATETQVVTVLAAPTASFNASSNAGCEGTMITYDATASTAVSTYMWSFPGGIPTTSTEAEPVVTYPVAGTYDVQLTVSNATGQDVELAQNAITILPNPVAGFSSDENMLTVAFESSSSNALSHMWTFGDGTQSTEIDPVHTYAAAGTYTVTLVVTNTCGTAEEVQTVTVIPGAPNAALSVVATSGCAPFVASFSAANSTNADTYEWFFPGAITSTATGVTASTTYDTSGTYDVILVVTNAAGSDTMRSTGLITVLDEPTAILRSPIVNGLTANLQVDIEDASTVDWDFGDGTMLNDASTMQTHQYPTIGTYDVIVTVTNSCGTARDTVEVLVGGVPDAEFDASSTRGCAPFEVELMDQTTGMPIAWEWRLTSQSGTVLTSSEQNPSFTLTEVGVYTVSLRATNAVGSSTEISTNFIRVIGAPTLSVDATVSMTDGLEVSFTSAATNNDDIVWNFGDGTSSMEDNPMHLYAAAGSYRVIATVNGECGMRSDTIDLVLQSSSTTSLPAGMEVLVYPNPLSEVATVAISGSPAETMTLRIVDALGREVYSQRMEGSLRFREQVPVADWTPGVYVVELTGQGVQYRSQLVKL